MIQPPSRLRRTTAVALCALLALLVSAPTWLHARVEPRAVSAEAPAQARFSVIRLDGVDAGRQREVPARLFWPQAARDGAVPLVLFSHGIGSSDDGYTHLGRYWANHGIASLHVRHVGSDRSLWQGNVLGLVRRFQRAAGDDEAMARAQDLHWALDHLLTTRYASRIDAARIVVAGHSYGANTAMLVAGARVTRNGAVLQFGDPRIRAAILISAPPFYGDADFAPILGGIAVPSLHVTTIDDVIHIPGFESGAADREKIFGAMGGDRTLAVFDRGSHNVFTDRRYFDTADVADSVKAATQRLTLQFLQSLDAGPGERFAALSALQVPGLAMRNVEGAAAMAQAARPGSAAQPAGARSVAHVRGKG